MIHNVITQGHYVSDTCHYTLPISSLKLKDLQHAMNSFLKEMHFVQPKEYISSNFAYTEFKPNIKCNTPNYCVGPYS